MSEVKLLAFALLIVVQAVSQDGPKVYRGLVACQDVLQLLPYPVPEHGPSSSPEQAQCGFADEKTSTVRYMPPYGDVAPPEWKTNPGLDARQDVLQMFPYPVPEDGPSSSPEQAQCGFADGKTITVRYSTRHIRDQQYMPPYRDVWRTVYNDIIFMTDESLITVKGMGVPAGDYAIAVSNPIPRVFLKLVMKSRNGSELRLPLSATKLASPAETSAISFEHTGGSCMMHVNEKNWNTQLSVEFTEKNADLPVAK